MSGRISDMGGSPVKQRKITDIRDRLGKDLPPGSRAGATHFPLMRLTTAHLSYGDIVLYKYISRWAPLAGRAPRAYCLTIMHQPTNDTISTRILGIEQRDYLAEERLCESYDGELSNARVPKKSKEAEKGGQVGWASCLPAP